MKSVLIAVFGAAFGCLLTPTTAFAADPPPCIPGPTDCNYDDIDEEPDASVKTDEGEVDPIEYDGTIIPEPAMPAAATGGEFILLSIRKWPETKTIMEMKCKKVIWKVCTKWPQIYKRDSHMQWIAQVTHPKWDKVKAAVEGCNKEAIGAAVLAGLLTESIPPALAAYEGYMKVCLSATGKKLRKDFKFGMYRKKTPGEWKKI